MQAIRSVFRYSYYENNSEFYSKIVMVSRDTAQEQGRWFNFMVCLCSLVFKKNRRSLFCLGLFSTCGESLPSHIFPDIPTGTHRGTCNHVRETESCTRSSGEQQDKQGCDHTNKGTVLPNPSMVQRARPMVVIRVSHRPVITRQTHSDQGGPDQAGKLVCGSGSARLGTGIPPSPATTELESAPGPSGGGSVGGDESSLSFSHPTLSDSLAVSVAVES